MKNRSRLSNFSKLPVQLLYSISCINQLFVRVHGVGIIELQEGEIFAHDMLRRVQLRIQTGFSNVVSKQKYNIPQNLDR